MTNTLDEMFCTVTQPARDLQTGDAVELPGVRSGAGYIGVVAHIKTSGRVVSGYFHSGETFRFGVLDIVRVQRSV